MTHQVADATRRLRAEVARYAHLVVRIPGDDPTGLPDGLLWTNATSNEGWQVDWLIEADGDSATVWLRHWEQDEAQPEWDEVRAEPVRARRDPDDWANDAAYQEARQTERDWLMRETKA